MSVLDENADLGVEILDLFRYRAWYIVHISTKVSEDVYLFYEHNPERGKFVGTFGGMSARDPDDPNAVAKAEREDISTLRQGMPNIPLKLGKCFAWHFEEERPR